MRATAICCMPSNGVVFVVRRCASAPCFLTRSCWSLPTGSIETVQGHARRTCVVQVLRRRCGHGEFGDLAPQSVPRLHGFVLLLLTAGKPPATQRSMSRSHRRRSVDRQQRAEWGRSACVAAGAMAAVWVLAACGSGVDGSAEEQTGQSNEALERGVTSVGIEDLYGVAWIATPSGAERCGSRRIPTA